MDVRQSFCILPSNGSSQSAEYLHDQSIPNGILQERSSNSQNDLYSSEERNRFKQEVAPLTENNYPGSQPKHSRSGRIITRGKTQQDLDEEFKFLYNWAKQNEAYSKYRSGQHKQQQLSQQPRSDASKWPNHLEEAFFRALVRFEPMGRSKESYRNSKPMGRNELIAAHIEQLTGEGIFRKRVSSHIQVLKAYFKDDPFVRRYFEGNRKSRHKSGRQMSHAVNATQTGQLFMNRAGMELRRPLHHPQLQHGAPPGGALIPGLSQPSDNVSPPQTSSVLEPHDFHMYIQDPSNGMTAMHTFTKYNKNIIRPDRQLDSNWHEQFPELAQMHQEGKLNYDSVLLGEVSMALNTQSLPSKARLCIASSFSSAKRLKQSIDWECRTRFYEHGGPKHEFEIVDKINHNHEGGRWIHDVPCGSAYWATKFHNMANVLKRAAHDSKHEVGAGDAVRHAEDQVRSHLKGITAVQEIIGFHKSQPKDVADTLHLMLIFWKFRQTRPGEAAVTSFQNLILPARVEPAMHASVDYQPVAYPALNLDLDAGLGNEASRNSSFDSQTYSGSANTEYEGLSSATSLDQTAAYDFDPLLSMADVDMTAGSEQHQLASMDSQQPLDFEHAVSDYAMPSLDAGVDDLHSYDPSIMNEASSLVQSQPQAQQAQQQQQHSQHLQYPHHPRHQQQHPTAEMQPDMHTAQHAHQQQQQQQPPTWPDEHHPHHHLAVYHPHPSHLLPPPQYIPHPQSFNHYRSFLDDANDDTSAIPSSHSTLHDEYSSMDRYRRDPHQHQHQNQILHPHQHQQHYTHLPPQPHHFAADYSSHHPHAHSHGSESYPHSPQPYVPHYVHELQTSQSHAHAHAHARPHPHMTQQHPHEHTSPGNGNGNGNSNGNSDSNGNGNGIRDEHGLGVDDEDQTPMVFDPEYFGAGATEQVQSHAGQTQDRGGSLNLSNQAQSQNQAQQQQQQQHQSLLLPSVID